MEPRHESPDPCRSEAVDKFSNPEDFGATKFILLDHKWQYRGEGNAHIVISLPSDRKVVRLRKTEKISDTDQWDYWHKLRLNISFVFLVMRSLLGRMFVSCPVLVYLSTEDIEILNKELISLRPENRKHKMLSFPGGELCDDFAFLPKALAQFCGSKSVCIELKLKQGVYPPSERHRRNCLFCCKQQLKIKSGLVSEKSQYCPLDIFSGCHLRMKHAVKSLLESPQNNLKIFTDGNLVFDMTNPREDLDKVLAEWLHHVPGSDLVERFSSLLVEALTKDMNYAQAAVKDCSEEWIYDGLSKNNVEGGGIDTNNVSVMPSYKFQQPCNYDSQELPEGSILHCLARAQALDQFGTVQVYHMLTSDERVSKDDSGNFSMESINIDYAEDIIRKGSSSKLSPIELYLIAAAVRDCSILITFQEKHEDFPEAASWPQVQDHPSKTTYLLKISAVDINPKPLSTISSHLKRNDLISKACTGTSSSK